MSIITEQLLVDCGGAPAGAKLYAGPLAIACDARGIDGDAIEPFLANIMNESWALTRVIEGTYYSTAARLRAVFPSKFPTEAAAVPWVGNSAGVASLVYNGWQGRGLPMLTGVANCSAYAAAIGMPLDKIKDYLVTPTGAADSAAWFFVQAGCRRLGGDLLAITRAWEGGSKPIGWASVQTWAGQVRKALAKHRPGAAAGTAAAVPPPPPPFTSHAAYAAAQSQAQGQPAGLQPSADELDYIFNTPQE